jgi:hypothetical protein
MWEFPVKGCSDVLYLGVTREAPLFAPTGDQPPRLRAATVAKPEVDGLGPVPVPHEGCGRDRKRSRAVLWGGHFDFNAFPRKSGGWRTGVRFCFVVGHPPTIPKGWGDVWDDEQAFALVPPGTGGLATLPAPYQC